MMNLTLNSSMTYAIENMNTNYSSPYYLNVHIYNEEIIIALLMIIAFCLTFNLLKDITFIIFGRKK